MKIARLLILIVCLIPLFVSTTLASEESAKKFSQYAYLGQFEEGKRILLQIAEGDPNDYEAKFGAGAFQFFGAISNLQKALYHYGAGNVLARKNRRGPSSLIPILRLPVPPNPKAQIASYEAVRGILEKFVFDLDKARTLLASIDGQVVKLPLDPFKIGIDLNADGEITENENMLAALLSVTRRRNSQNNMIGTIAFDTADVSWLRGYSNLLMATANFFLAFDFQESYETSFQMLFGNEATRVGREIVSMKKRLVNEDRNLQQIEELMAEILKLSNKQRQLRVKIEAPMKKLRKEEMVLKRAVKSENSEARLAAIEVERIKLGKDPDRRKMLRETSELEVSIQKKRTELRNLGYKPRQNSFIQSEIFDAISFIHTLNWKVVSPDKLASVRTDMLEVMRLNHITWKAVMAETDNDREWLPNAKQDGPMGFGQLPQATIDGWLNVVELVEEVLNGNRLLPHIRFTHGINLKKFFEEADSLDIVLFLTGPNALPYLETGKPIVDRRTWQALTRPFGRNFGLFMVWFN